jgi:hypothetical protein
MQGGSEEAWKWSGQFLEVLERWLRQPPADAITRWDWPKLQLRLVLWRSEVLAARRRYVEAYPESLRWLHDYWRTIFEDMQEQVRLACESYHQFHSVLGNLSGSE